MTNERSFQNYHPNKVILKVGNRIRPSFKTPISGCYKELITKCLDQKIVHHLMKLLMI